MTTTKWQSRGAKKNKKLLRALHLEHADCALVSNECSGPMTLHHVLGGKYGREDHVSNLVRLCRAHHEAITLNDIQTRMDLGAHIIQDRMDVVAYIRQVLGRVSGDDWLRRRLFINV